MNTKGFGATVTDPSLIPSHTRNVTVAEVLNLVYKPSFSHVCIR